MKITSRKETLPKGTIKLTITVPWSEIKPVYEKILREKSKTIEVAGFRKGKSPLSLAKKKIGEDVLFRETLQEILPEAYAKTIKEHELKPIIQPKIQVLAIEEGKDWQFEATTCEKPVITLGNWQEEVKNALRGAKIWVPGKKEKEKKESEAERLKELFETLLATLKIKLPQILVEEETNRLLSNLLDQINKLGLTLDTYLQSVKKTIEQLKQEYHERAERTLKLEFILEEIADDLKVEVEEKEIEEMIKKVPKNEKEKRKLSRQKYYLASIIRRQKTIDKLLNL